MRVSAAQNSHAIMHFILCLLSIVVLGFGYREVMFLLTEDGQILDGLSLQVLAVRTAIIVLLSAVIASLVVPRVLRRPSDLFVLVYVIMVVIPKIFLFGIYSEQAATDLAVMIFFLIGPLIFIKSASKIALTSPNISSFRMGPYFSSLPSVVLGLFCAGAVIALFRNDLSLDFTSHYDRRFAFRDVTSGSVLFGYFFNFVATALAPFLAFIGVYRKQFVPIFFGASLCLLVFSISGEKFPILMTGASMGLAWVMAENIHGFSVIWTLAGMSLLNIIAIAEFYLLDASLWGDWIFRRFIVVPSHVTEIYHHYLMTADNLTMTGGGDARVTYRLGERYFEQPDLNLNTNFAFVEMAVTGWLGLAVAITFLTLWLKVLDELYRRSSDPRLYLVALLIALLAFEQRIYSVFLSSGIGLLTALICSSVVLRPRAAPR